MDAENKKINDVIKQLYVLNTEHKKMIDEYEKKKTKLQKEVNDYLYSNNKDAHSFIFATKKVTVKKISKNVLKWDLKKLEKKLGVKSSKLIKRTLKAENKKIEKLFDYLKSIGADWERVKPLIEIERELDEAGLEQMLNLGMIRSAEIKDCYEIEETTSYLRFF